MTCFNPLVGYAEFNQDGFIDTQINFRKKVGEKVYVPCRHCIGCAVHQKALLSLLFKMQYAQALQDNVPASFITLTYADEHLPPSGIAYQDCVQFIRSFKQFLRRGGYPHDIAYIRAAEYGLKNMRAHFHIAMVGVSPREFDYLFNKEYRCYALNRFDNSPCVDHFWKKGYNTCAELNMRRVCYTAGYTVKKIMVIGDIHDVIKKTTEYRRRAAGFNGLLSPNSERAYRLAGGHDVKEFVKEYNRKHKQMVPEFIEYNGRRIENPKFPKGRVFNYKNKYYRVETVRASESLGNEYYERYKSDFFAGFIRDPLEPEKIRSIPPKFLKKMMEDDYFAYAVIKRNKADFVRNLMKTIEDTQQYYTTNENALKMHLRGLSERPLDMLPLSSQEEDEIENDFH